MFLRMEHIYKKYGDLFANKDVALTLEKGEILALVGENGAGKSTLMKILYGLVEPNSGDIFINDKNLLCHEQQQEWQQCDLAANVPHIYPNTIGLFTPHMLNLPAIGAVSFTKGCYTGQEIIARTEHLGKSKKVLQQTVLSKAVKPGDRLENGGLVVYAVAVSDGKWLVMLVN